MTEAIYYRASVKERLSTAVDLARAIVGHSGTVLPRTQERERESVSDIVRNDIFLGTITDTVGCAQKRKKIAQ